MPIVRLQPCVLGHGGIAGPEAEAFPPLAAIPEAASASPASADASASADATSSSAIAPASAHAAVPAATTSPTPAEYASRAVWVPTPPQNDKPALGVLLRRVVYSQQGGKALRHLRLLQMPWAAAHEALQEASEEELTGGEEGDALGGAA